MHSGSGLFALAILVFGCGDQATAPATCVAGLDTSCKPLYADTSFTTLHQKIIQPTCASSAGQCHTAAGHEAGLVMEDADTAYKALLGMTGKARVSPGDPSCSLVMERLEASDPAVRMPPSAAKLSNEVLCNFTLWIAQGAKR